MSWVVGKIKISNSNLRKPGLYNQRGGRIAALEKDIKEIKRLLGEIMTTLAGFPVSTEIVNEGDKDESGK